MLTKSRLAFASFHFQVTSSAPSEFTGGDYLDWIEKTLGEIATVTNIHIRARDNYRLREMELPSSEELQAMEEDDYFFPRLQFVTIEFEISVPTRFQAELSERGLRLDDQVGERFSISVQDGWKTSIVMIRPLDGSGDPCDGVIVVREFLKREFDRLGERPVGFRCLGPSPAHIRILLEPRSGVRDFERTAHRRRGYDEYDIRCGDGYESDDQMCRAFFLRVGHELDIYYRMAVARGRHLRLWAEAVSDTDAILDAYKRPGFKGFLSRLLQGRKARAALISLGEVELRQQDDKQEFDHSFRATYDVGDGLFSEAIRDDLDELEPRPIAPLSSLLQLLDGSRQAHRDVAVASVATLFGAAVAAVAALIAAG